MPRPISINISSDTLQRVNSEVAGYTAEELKQSAELQDSYMRKVALDFINVVQENLEKLNLLESNAQKLQDKRRSLRVEGEKTLSPPALQEYLNFKADLESKINIDTSLDDFFAACLIFNDRILQLITGKETRTTIVIPQADGEPPIIVDYSLEELLAKDSGVSIYSDIQSRTNRITGRLRYDIAQLKAKMNNALRQDNYKSVAGLSELNITYNSALGTYTKFSPYVFWRPTTEKYWYKMKVAGGKGDLAEAYAAMHYLNLSAFAGRHLYDNLDTYYRQGVASVDSISGLYSSDILADDLAYTYAVKSIDAGLPGYQQMLSLATRILNNKIGSVEQLKKIAEGRQYKMRGGEKYQKGLRNHIEQTSEIYLENVYKTTVAL